MTLEILQRHETEARSSLSALVAICTSKYTGLYPDYYSLYILRRNTIRTKSVRPHRIKNCFTALPPILLALIQLIVLPQKTNESNYKNHIFKK